jgi:hypothetical protein
MMLALSIVIGHFNGHALTLSGWGLLILLFLFGWLAK